MMVGDDDEIEEDAPDNEDEPTQPVAGKWLLLTDALGMSIHVLRL